MLTLIFRCWEKIDTQNIGWYSRKVTNFKHAVFNSGMLVNCFMEHQVLTYSLHFN